MGTEHHGISVGIERAGEELLLTLHVKGKLTHADYQALIPMLESAIAGMEHPKINAYVDATQLQGWELRAAWDDLKLGLKHGRQFHRVAVVGNSRWQELATKMGSWFIGGEAKYFEAAAPAKAWLQGAV